MSTEKKFAVAGVSTLGGKTKVRFTFLLASAAAAAARAVADASFCSSLLNCATCSSELATPPPACTAARPMDHPWCSWRTKSVHPFDVALSWGCA